MSPESVVNSKPLFENTKWCHKWNVYDAIGVAGIIAAIVFIIAQKI